MCLFVSEPAVALDHGVADAIIQYFGFVIHPEYAAIGIFFFVGAEGTKVVAEAFGEHRDGAIHEIDTCGTVVCFLIYDPALGYVVRDIGDMYAYLIAIILQRTERYGIIEVLGILRVDGESEYRPKIFSSGKLFFCDLPIQTVGCLFHLLGIDIRQSEFGQNGIHLGIVVSGRSQYGLYLSDGILGLLRPFEYSDYYLIAVFGVAEVVFGDENIIR